MKHQRVFSSLVFSSFFFFSHFFSWGKRANFRILRQFFVIFFTQYIITHHYHNKKKHFAFFFSHFSSYVQTLKEAVAEVHPPAADPEPAKAAAALSKVNWSAVAKIVHVGPRLSKVKSLTRRFRTPEECRLRLDTDYLTKYDIFLHYNAYAFFFFCIVLDIL